QKDVKSMQATVKQVGTAMAAFGAAVTAAFGLAVQQTITAGDEIQKMSLRTGFGTESLSKLKYAADQSGSSLDDVEKSAKRLAAVMLDADQGLKTANDSFKEIGLTTKDLKGLRPEDQFLKVANAVARVEDPMKKAAVAQELFGRAGTQLLPLLSEGEQGMEALMNRADELGIVWTEDAANAAVRFGDALDDLKKSVQGVAYSVGTALLENLQPLIDQVIKITSAISRWTKEHPELTKTLSMIGVAIGVVTGALGGLMLIIPKVAAGIRAFGAVVKLGTGPIGWAVLAIEALTMAGIALWQNWDKVKAFFVEAFEAIKSAVLNGVKAIMDSLIKFAGWIPDLKGKLEEAKQAIDGMIDAEKVAGDMRQLNSEVERLAASLTETIKGEIEKRRDAELAGIETRRGDAQKEYDSAVEAINRKYGKLEDAEKDLTQSLSEQARERAQITKDSYDKEIDAAKDALNAKLAMLDKEKAARLAAFDEGVSDEIRQIQRQIDAIDKQSEAEELARQRATEAQKLADLQAAIDSAATEEDRIKAIEAYAEYETEIRLKELDRQRKAEKDALRDKIDRIREEAEEDRKSLEKQLEKEYEQKKDAVRKVFEEITLPALMEEINTRKTEVDKALREELAAIEQQRLDALEIEGKKYTNSEKTGIFDMLDKEKDTVTAHYENQLTEAQLHVAAINEATAQLKNRTVTITTVHKSVHESSSSGGTSSSVTLPGFATGAVIKEPTLLTNIRTGAAVGVAGEAGIERLVPGNGGGNVNISINNPVIRDRYDVKKLGKDLVAELRLAGVKI
ncbi:MAG: phage tail tape measure protein, partial [Candidatus Cloacimonadaceae bacterium]